MSSELNFKAPFYYNCTTSSSTFLLFAAAGVSIWGVLTNVPYMTLVSSTLCCYYILPSIYQQVPKYLNIQFHVTPSMSSIYTGSYRNYFSPFTGN